MAWVEWSSIDNREFGSVPGSIGGFSTGLQSITLEFVAESAKREIEKRLNGGGGQRWFGLRVGHSNQFPGR